MQCRYSQGPTELLGSKPVPSEFTQCPAEWG